MSDRDDDLAARLTEDARAVTEAFTAEEVAAIRRYQGLDRTYELVAAVLRDPLAADGLPVEQARLVNTIVRMLDAATRRWVVPEDLIVYRGQRSVMRALGSGNRVGRTIALEAFMSTSIHRAVAVDEFAAPPGPGGAALLKVAVPAGTPALWLPPVGDPDLAYQGELLLARDGRIIVKGELVEAGILVVDCEVLP